MDFLGKVLHIDLTTEKTWIEDVEPEDWMKYLPSRGINAKFLWDLTDENTDPLGKDNVLIFGTGGLTGTGAPVSGRTTVTFKSPATNMYFKSNAGGEWGAYLKFTGYGYLIIHGKAEKPVYIYIEDEKVQIKDATKLWGKDVRETNELLKKEHGDKRTDFATIGPAGEKLARISAIMFTTYSAAARGGGGAVMGSKNLKAIAVKGTNKMRIENEEFNTAAAKARKSVMNDSGFKGLSTYGTSGSVIPLNESYAWPTKNFQRGHFEDGDKISGEEILESGRLQGSIACYSCVIGCHRNTRTKGNKYQGFGGGPELETVDSFGAGTMVSDLDAIVKANELCNINGLDTISTGSVIQWAMESFDKGILTEEDTDGLELIWGNGEAMVEMVRKIAHREGLGDILAEGVKRAAEKFGQGSEKWAIESKGLEQSGVDTRMAKGYALAFAVNPRGADHLHTETFAELGFSEEGRKVIKEITKSDDFIEPTSTEKRAEIVRWHEDVFAITDALGFCAFTTTALYGITPEMLTEMWSLALDKEVSVDELMKAGRRMVTLEKAYNVRCGADRSDDRLPWRIMNEDAEVRPGDKYMANTQEELDVMLDEYYQLHGWDQETSWPTEEVLEELGLDFVIQEFKEKGKLP